MILPLCLFLLILVVLQSSADLALEHPFFASLDEDQDVNLYWNVKTEEKEIYFTIEAKTTGWIGFGISSGQGKMKGADIVIGWVKDGKTFFKVSKCMLVFKNTVEPPISTPQNAEPGGSLMGGGRLRDLRP